MSPGGRICYCRRRLTAARFPCKCTAAFTWNMANARGVRRTFQWLDTQARPLRRRCLTVRCSRKRRVTLVLPIPPFVRSYQTVTVDGVQGTLMTSLNRRGPQSVLIWVKDGIIYCLATPDGASETLDLANSLE